MEQNPMERHLEMLLATDQVDDVQITFGPMDTVTGTLKRGEVKGIYCLISEAQPMQMGPDGPVPAGPRVTLEQMFVAGAVTRVARTIELETPTIIAPRRDN